MNWNQPDKYFLQSDQGYLICAAKDHRSKGWRFTASSPERKDWRIDLKVHYKIGETMPVERECLGVHSSIDLAKRACIDHWEGMNNGKRKAV